MSENESRAPLARGHALAVFLGGAGGGLFVMGSRPGIGWALILAAAAVSLQR